MTSTLKIKPLSLPEVLLIEPALWKDPRGYFFESYNQRIWSEETGITSPFVQDNHSRSVEGVLRGLHYQLDHPQGKLLRVIHGAIFDVAVDVRKNSKTFGKWTAITLNAPYQIIWIPPGFAHGFLVLSPEADVLYKTTDYYDPHSQECLRWDDPDIAIPWPLKHPPLLSSQDSQGKPLSQVKCFP